MLTKIVRTGQKIARRWGYDVRQIISFNNENSVYKNTFSSDDLQNRRFVNIGAGSFRHPYWTNVDHASEWYKAVQSAGQVEWDIMGMNPCPIASEEMKVVYTSHTIEHVVDDAALHMFKEAYRMLSSDGVFRITAPDALLLHNAYKRNDISFFSNEDGTLPLPEGVASIEEQFLYCVASQRTNFHPECHTGLTREEIHNLLSTQPIDQALDTITQECLYDIQSRHPGNHINWWGHDKIRRMLEIAGFKHIYISAYGQSCSPVLRNTSLFDSTRPKISLYVEAVK